MSPPTVSLARKEPLKSTFDDVFLAEKENGVEAPAVITLDTDRRARNLRQAKKQKRCRFIFCAVSMVIILGLAAALTVTLMKVLHRHRHTWKVEDTAGQTMHVNVDDHNNLIHASHDNSNSGNSNNDNSNNGNSNQNHVVVIEILHEYKRQLIAYRDVKNQTCYIDRMTETFADGLARWQSYEKEGRAPRALKVISDKPIEVEVLKHIGDVHIYAHCKSGNSYWVMEYEETEVTTVTKVVYA
uniref:BRICHOS domain-containing protein n=1 Tax=Arion vulgaris TaxID=1028688 RepID=A0A0B7ANG3_9EUPU